MTTRSEPLRKQHGEIMGIAKEIAANLNNATLQNNAADVVKLLIQLASKLTTHLAAEDRVLYPTMLKHADAKVNATAKKYADEMGGLAEAFKAYVGKWNRPAAIQADTMTFITETKGVFDAVRKRIDRENAELYPMYDTI